MRRYLSDPIFQVGLTGFAFILPVFLKYIVGIDLQAYVPEDIDINATIPIVVVVGLLAFNAARILISGLILPSRVICHDVRYFYSFAENGDFEASIINKVENRSKRVLYRVPNETLIWNQELKSGEVLFKILYREGDRPHAFRNKGHSVSPIDIAIDKLRGRQPYSVTWSPEVDPGVARGETIAYEVLMSTPGTEGDAFSDTGSTLGFPVSIDTFRVQLIAKAPFGYEFRFVEPRVEIISIESGMPTDDKTANLPEPKISDDGSLLEWEIKKPDIGRRYWINYRFAKKAFK